jgi:phosphoglycolate phosphatase
VLGEAGRPAPDIDEVRAMIGLPLAAIFARWLPEADGAEIEARVERYRQVYAETVIPRTFLFPGAWSLLRACRAAGLELALVTAKSTPVAEAVLARCRIRRLFRSVVGGDRASRPKPYPDLLQIAFGELGVDPAAVLAVGDGDHDIAMGRAAGARPCAVTWGVHSAERLRAAEPDFLVDSPVELRDRLLPALLASPLHAP